MKFIWNDIERPEFDSLEGDIKTDALIIGGGICGILCSYMLKMSGVDCVLVEADRICAGVTNGTTAKLTFQHGLIYDKIIKKYGKDIPYDHKTKKNAEGNNLFVWNGLYFATYDCFELADANYRCEFKSNVDLIIACEWNKDLDYFNNIIKSAAREIHCYVTQVNTSQFGDSKVIAPKKSSEMTLLNIKGGEDNILIGKLNIEELREFQRKETESLEESEKIFKPLPPAFQKETNRLTDNKI